MGNFVSTGSRVSENGEGAEFVELNGSSEDKTKANDVKMESLNDSGPIEDYVMSEASSLLNTRQEGGDFDDDEDEENDEEEEGYEFHVGDFVWVEEVNCHKLWPGRIYDSSDASDLALKQMQKGKLLVAYFWDETFAWCNPSQLKPFLENFSEFSKTSDSRRFLSAVEEAVREIGQHVENLLVCDESLVSPAAVNSGIKEGVLVPDVRREILTSLVLEKSGIVLEDLKSLARTASFSDLLKIEVLRRKISAFYRSKGRFDLAEYDEHRYIIGLEDKEDEYALNFDSSSGQRSLRKCSGLGSYKKRKYGEEVNKVDLADVATTDSTTLRRRVIEVSKIENADLKQVEEMSNEKSFSSRKRKNNGIKRSEESNDSNHLEDSEKKEDSGIRITVDLSTPLTSLCKKVKVDVSSSVEKNNGNGETVQTGKRERKKSKYLSPEYMTDFSWSARKSKIESSQIQAAERMTKTSAEKAINFVRLGDTPEEEILDLIRAAALSTQYLKDYYDSSYDMIREFLSIYRSFTYQKGAYNQNHNRNISDVDKQPEVKEQVVDEQEQIRNEPNETVQKNQREVEKQISGVELFIKSGFGPGSTLPSKDDLMSTYKKFGALDKERSCLFDNNSCARVFFLNVSDGEEAFYKSLVKCPFATTSTVTFNLKYPSSETPKNPNEKKEAETRKGVMEIQYLKKKLEEMRALVDQSEGGITEELKMRLEDESRNFLDKVSKMSVRSS